MLFMCLVSHVITCNIQYEWWYSMYSPCSVPLDCHEWLYHLEGWEPCRTYNLAHESLNSQQPYDSDPLYELTNSKDEDRKAFLSWGCTIIVQNALIWMMIGFKNICSKSSSDPSNLKLSRSTYLQFIIDEFQFSLCFPTCGRCAYLVLQMWLHIYFFT